MTIKEAMESRHTVRRYTDRPIPRELVDRLTVRIEENNREYGLSMKLVTENAEAFGVFLRLVLAKGVRHYLILSGRDTADTDEKLGYCGTDVMLYAQTLGLNSWWVGGTFNRKGVKKNAAANAERVAGVVALGYGATQGVPHPSRRPEEISRYQGTAPEWFTRGVEAVLLAPTALNKQAFTIRGDGTKVSMTCSSGIFSGVDLGIGRYHFETGAGRENFEWVQSTCVLPV
ncbi:MAG: nitroreductase [Clostridiales bacterium]|nr:nitroreductase [Clostridiales bacterium]